MEEIIKDIERAGVRVKHHVEGAQLTTFGSGGIVSHVIYPANVEELTITVKMLYAASLPYRVIGGGSNLLLPDEGYGVLISLSRFDSAAVCGEFLSADAGVKLPRLARMAAEHSLSGLEFACGIPAMLGGAVRNNAGAFGQSISDALVAVVLLTEQGEIASVGADELKTAYHRCFLPEGSIFLSAVFSLKTGDRREIEGRMADMRRRRCQTQPHEPSAGSVFRRVGEIPAAVYIERTGLKGLCFGGAELSEVHCNFIVNKGGASTADYFAVAERVRESVLQNFGVALEYEVERICSPKKN